MSAAARAAGGTFYQRAGAHQIERERWQDMQRDMKRIAEGELPVQKRDELSIAAQAA